VLLLPAAAGEELSSLQPVIVKTVKMRRRRDFIYINLSSCGLFSKVQPALKVMLYK
jgi:hypothetical protein